LDFLPQFVNCADKLALGVKGVGKREGKEGREKREGKRGKGKREGKEGRERGKGMATFLGSREPVPRCLGATPAKVCHIRPE
jgi:hypothetical protein